MEQRVVIISENHRRMLISLSMVICLLAVIVLVIAADMLSLIISRKDHAAKVSKPEAVVQGNFHVINFLKRFRLPATGDYRMAPKRISLSLVG